MGDARALFPQNVTSIGASVIPRIEIYLPIHPYCCLLRVSVLYLAIDVQIHVATALKTLVRTLQTSFCLCSPSFYHYINIY